MYMRESWTDERLDDFRGEVDRRFDEVSRRFDEVDRRFDKVDTRLDRMDDRFERIEVRLEGIQRTMLQFGVGGIATMAIGFLGLILAHA
jgi:hypothetical protein